MTVTKALRERYADTVPAEELTLATQAVREVNAGNPWVVLATPAQGMHTALAIVYKFGLSEFVSIPGTLAVEI